MSSGLLTMAFGPDRYVELAKTLGRSLARWAPDVPRAVVTDSDDAELARLFPVRVPVRAELGTGVAQKLALYDYSPFDQTLFIDADSIAVRSLDWLWDLFARADRPVGVVGRPICEGEWFMDVAEACRRLGVPSLPLFNGGLYYFRKGDAAASVFAAARSFAADYEALGLRAFRGGVNDEPVMALALARHGIGPVDDAGAAMRTPLGISGRLSIDVLAGRASFVKEGAPVRPAVVHFAGEWAASAVYRREAAKLRLAGAGPSRWRDWLVGRACDAAYVFDPLRRWADPTFRRQRRAWRVIGRRVPAGSTLVLVDDNQWTKPAGLRVRVLPFLERGGEFWGWPDDDETAVAELDRMRAAGASHVAVAWASRWWFDTYPGFAARLRQQAGAAVEARDVTLFDLR